jgi:hypothetical protein
VTSRGRARGQEQLRALKQDLTVSKQLFQQGLAPAEDVSRLSRKLMETKLRMAMSAKEWADIRSDALAPRPKIRKRSWRSSLMLASPMA